MITKAPTATLTEIWVECDVCRLRMFGGFVPISMTEVTAPYKRHGWQFSADRVLCDYCTAQKASA